MILEQVTDFVNPTYVAAALGGIFLALTAWNYISYATKFRAAGGVNGPRLSNDPLTGRQFDHPDEVRF